MDQRGERAEAFRHVVEALELRLCPLETLADPGGGQILQREVAQRAPTRIGRVIAVRPGHFMLVVKRQPLLGKHSTQLAHQRHQRRAQRRGVGHRHPFEQIGFGR